MAEEFDWPLNQADRVIAPVSCRDTTLPISTYWLDPFKEIEFVPILPTSHAGLPKRVPVELLPLESTAVLPVPSSNAQYPTRPVSMSASTLIGKIEKAEKVKQITKRDTQRGKRLGTADPPETF
jgi:hypothetical protein